MVFTGGEGTGWWYFIFSPMVFNPAFWLSVVIGLSVMWLTYSAAKESLQQRLAALRYRRSVKLMWKQMNATAQKDAENNWEDIERILLAKLGHTASPDDEAGMAIACVDYLWYYRTIATRGIDLKWYAVCMPRSLREADREVWMPELAKYYRRNRELQEAVLDDLRGLNVPDYYLRVPYRCTLSNAPVLFA
jgi:hypothetical protein